jgi:hypothetical protein
LAGRHSSLSNDRRQELGALPRSNVAVIALKPSTEQIVKQMLFAMANRDLDWSTTVFTDERAETRPKDCWVKGKFPPTGMMSAWISRDDKSNLIIMESGIINADMMIWNQPGHGPEIWLSWMDLHAGRGACSQSLINDGLLDDYGQSDR